MSGFVGDLSPKQVDSLRKLQERFDGVALPEDGDHYLLKWLRARHFDVDKAEKMLRNHLKFREEWNVQSVVENWKQPEVLEKYQMGGLYGYDKEGCPVWYAPFGRLDILGLCQSATERDFIHLTIITCEEILSQLRQQTEKLGHRIETLLVVMDLARVSWSHIWKPCVELYRKVFTIFEANYPEVLKKCYIINAPSFFYIGYNLIKPFLSEDTKTKVVILGENYEDVLREAISTENLPAHYGGSAVDPDGDPRCVSKIKFGGKVPESYYFKNANNRFSEDRMKKVQVSPGSKVEFPFEVEEPGSTLKWEFNTKDADIGFGVVLKKSSPEGGGGGGGGRDLVEVVKTQRYDSHLVPQIGVCTCTEPGTYIVEFDNTFSWLRSKEVAYNIDILRETSEELD